MKRVVVIGAGVGGLTAAAALSRAGLDVTVLEAHIYPGGCAGTFYHQGYRFEAGATLAGGFYPGGPMDLVAEAAGIQCWPVRYEDLAMVVRLPGLPPIHRWADQRATTESVDIFGAKVKRFWRWQQETADALWDLALRLPPWPPQSFRQSGRLLSTMASWMIANPIQRISPTLAADVFRPMAFHIRDLPDDFKLFIDGQLLISAQTTSEHANALYSASALDLPRRGVVHLEGGIGSIAEYLTAAVRRNGGKVIFREEVKAVNIERGKPFEVVGKRGESYPADVVIANLTPWNLRRLLGDQIHSSIRNLPEKPHLGWGAFTTYVGLDSDVIPDDFPLHHQVIQKKPLGEGNSVFLSLSPPWDTRRAPPGKRALTISTHTELNTWWKLYEQDPESYRERSQFYLNKVVATAEQAIPGLRQAANLILPGTPVTFQRFTRRMLGWVGGFPQTNLFRALSPQVAPGVWMVGDSIFPGQSTAAVALGGLRVAKEILR